MSLIRLDRDGEDLALVFRLQHIVTGAVRYARPTYAHVVKIDGWFGARWRCFAGTLNGKDLHPEDRLAVPPFAPNRVVSEFTYRRRADAVKQIKARRLHESASRSSSVTYLDEHTTSGVFVWYSGNTATQDRASVMVYEVEKAAEQRAWYAELQRREGTWTVSATVGTSVTELAELETAYGNRLEPLFEHVDDTQRRALRALWERVLEAAKGADVARAIVLIDQYRAIKPDDPYIRLLHGGNLTVRRLFDEADQELRAIEHGSPHDGWRVVWINEWAELCDRRGNLVAAEVAYRELAHLRPDVTSSWILLGAFLARHGKLDEAEAAHRHGTELRGDPDEAFLNLGLVLRARGRLEEAAAAFESALGICPDYPEASAALADVRAALELRGRDT